MVKHFWESDLKNLFQFIKPAIFKEKFISNKMHCPMIAEFPAV
jgi:hypothetical protein